jgi:hypothetical protein
MLTKTRIMKLEEQLSSAYSTDRYRNGWRACIKMLYNHGLSIDNIEAVICSKWTRWAADASKARYGYCTAKDLERFMDSNKDCGWDAVEQLTLEHFGVI